MTPAQISLVETSFAMVAPLATPAAAAFYERLFELDPALRPLFRNADLVVQGRKLMQAIGFVATNLRVPDQLLPAVIALGERHGTYGVQPAHYDTVATALLDVLQDGLGAAFTPELREAWAAAYALLAETMIAAAGSTASA